MTAASNEAALAWLARAQDWPDHRLLLWGEAGCGKTHLLHVWAARVGARLLPGPSLAGMTFPPPGALAIDDADLAEETALFHLLNAAREQRCSVLLTARLPPSRWRILLPDLRSRMRSLTVVEIGRAEDSLLRALLARLLADRQLAVPAPLQERLLLRLPRTPAALREAVTRIDTDGRVIGQKLADDILREMASPECDLSESAPRLM